MSLESMIMKMESMLGVNGTPNEATNWYADRNGEYFRRAPWCNMTITWAAYHSGNYDEVCFGKDYAYTVYHAQEFQRRGQWHVDTEGIKRGDIVFFDWGGTNHISAIDHIGIVTEVNGRDVLTIEGNTSDSCRRRVRRSAEIAGYGRPAYQATARPTTPKGEPQHGSYVPPAFPKGLRPNNDNPSAKALQRALKSAGYMARSVKLADNYGPLTQAAVARFHDRNPQYAERDYDVEIGPRGWAELHREAYG